MKTMVLGSSGMLGQQLMIEGRKRGLDIKGYRRTPVPLGDFNGDEYHIDDISYDFELKEALKITKPDVIINTVAVTDLSDCESDPNLAYRVNTRPLWILTNYCKENNVHLVHISTDHFWRDTHRAQYEGYQPTAMRLVNEYAMTKYLAEQLVATCWTGLSIRTNILGPKNLDWFYKALKNREPMTLWHDFYSSPIDIYHFAEALFDLIPLQRYGVINLAGRTITSKSEFFTTLALKLGQHVYWHKEQSVDSICGPKRGNSLGLDVSKIEKILRRPMPNMFDVIDRILAEKEKKALILGGIAQ